MRDDGHAIDKSRDGPDEHDPEPDPEVAPDPAAEAGPEHSPEDATLAPPSSAEDVDACMAARLHAAAERRLRSARPAGSGREMTADDSA